MKETDYPRTIYGWIRQLERKDALLNLVLGRLHRDCHDVDQKFAFGR